jgi:hypothetical protein
MASTGIFRRRVFRHPFLKRTEAVGPHSVVLALLSGPIYYWQKRARLEAVVLCVVATPMLVYDPDSALVSRALLSDITTLVWAVSVVLAPLFLALSYHRQGWSEVAESD